MPTNKKKPAAPPASKPAKAPRHKAVSPVSLIPPDERQATAAEKRAFAALIATGSSQLDAYRALRPGCSDETGKRQGWRWAQDLAGEIGQLKQAAATAAAIAHGITAAWVLGEAKEMYLTPLAQIGPDSRFCRKHKVTTTHTDAGPKVTTEVEKDPPLAILKTIAELSGLDGSALREAASQPAEGGQEAEKAALGRALAMIIKAGSPIARRIEEQSNAEMTGK